MYTTYTVHSKTEHSTKVTKRQTQNSTFLQVVTLIPASHSYFKQCQYKKLTGTCQYMIEISKYSTTSRYPEN